MPTSNWFAEVGDFLGGWPRDYIVVDLETNGPNPHDSFTLPLQLGWVLVEDCVPVNSGSVMLNWTLPTYGINSMELALSMQRVHEFMTKKKRVYHMTMDKVADGVDPAEALQALGSLVSDSLAAGYKLVGHNVYNYDRPILERVWGQYAGLSLPLTAAAIVDTMRIEQSRILKIMPPDYNSVLDWYQAMQKRPFTRCNLAEHCAQVYGLPSDPLQAHDAGYDTHLNHLLLESMRALAAEDVAAHVA